VARTGGRNGELWLRLAAVRAKSHPGEAADVYLARVEPTVASSYEEAVALLQKARPLLIAAGRTAELPRILADVRARHGRKRNLMRLLERLRW
jgi:uncharacterized Zn finger protein